MIDSDGAVVHEVSVALPPAEVFEFYHRRGTPRALDRTLSIAERCLGGKFRFEIQPGQFCEGAYVEVLPVTFVSFTWGWADPAWNLPPSSSLVSVALAPTDGGTQVRLMPTRLPGDLRVIHDEGWSTFLGRLVAATAGREPASYPPVGRP